MTIEYRERAVIDKMASPQALLLEENIIDRSRLQQYLTVANLPYDCTLVSHLPEVNNILETRGFDCVFLSMPWDRADAIALLQTLHEQAIPVIVGVSSGEEAYVTQLMDLGATDFLIKDPQHHYLELLQVTLQKVTRTHSQQVPLQQQAFLDQLSEWQNRYQAAERATGQVVYEWDSVTNNITWGANFEQVLQYPLAEAPYYVEDWLTKIHPDDVLSVQATLQACITHKDPVHLQYRWRCQDGHYIWVEDRAEWFVGHQGERTSAVGCIADISDRKQLELGLQQSEAQLTEVLDQALAGIVRLRFYPDTSMRYDYLSRQCESILGFTVEEFQADDTLWQSRIHPEDWEHVIMPTFNAVLASRCASTHYLEYRFYRKDGSVCWVAANCFVAWNERNAYWDATIVDTDISDYKQLESSLRNSEAQLNQIFDNSQDVFFLKTFSGDQMIYTSPAWEELYQTPLQQTYSNPNAWFDFIHPDDYEIATTFRQQAHQGENFGTCEHRIIRPDGSIRWVWNRTFPIRNEVGEIYRVGGINTDITARKQAEIALQESQLSYLTLAESAPVGIFRTDAIGDYIYANTSLCQLAGLPQAALLGKGWVNAVHPEDRDRVFQEWYDTTHRQDPFLMECRLCTPSGLVNWLIVHAVAERDLEGHITGYVGTLTNISDRKQFETVLQASQTQLEAELLAMSTLYAFSTRLSEVADLDAALTEILHASVAILQADLGHVQLYNPQRGKIERWASDEFSQNPLEDHGQIKGFDELYQSALESGNRVIIRDLQTEIPSQFNAQKTALNYPALQVSPLISRSGESLGIIATYFSQPHTPSERQLRTLDLYQQHIIALLERQHAQIALAASEARYRAVFEQANVGIVETTNEGRFIRANHFYFKLLGYTEADILNRTFQSLPSLTDETEISLTHQQQILNRELGNFSVEKRLVQKGGQLRWANITVSPIQDILGTTQYQIAIIHDIEERKQAELALQASEAKLNDVLSSAGAAIGHFRFHPDGTWQTDYHSNGCEIIFGYPPHDFSAEIWLSNILPEDFDTIQEVLYQAIQTEQKITLEYRFQHRNGTICWISDTITSQWIAEKACWVVTAIGADISARKQTEMDLHQALSDLTQKTDELESKTQELRQTLLDLEATNIDLQIQHHRLQVSEATKRAILNTIPEQIIRMTRNGTYLDVTTYDEGNGVILESRTQDRHSLSPVSTHIGQQRLHYAELALQTGISQTYEYEIEIDGKCSYCEECITTYEEDAVLVMVRDISDRKRVELELLRLNQELEARIAQRTIDLTQSEARYRVLFEQAAVGISCCDLSGRYLQVNQRFCDLTGYSEAELLTCSWQDIIHPDDLETEQTKLTQSLTSVHSEIRYICKNGQTRWVSITVSRLHDLQDEPVGELAIIQDINDRKQAEHELHCINQQLLLTNTELERATRLKDEFLASMSHELRTPLNAILGMTEGLKDDVFGTINTRQQQAITTIEESGRHLLELINDILDLAKIEAGKLEIKPTAADVTAICASSLNLINQLALQKHITLDSYIQPNLRQVHGDERRLRQALINLLSNAVKFTLEGGHVSLRVSYEPDQHAVKFMVTDTGIGIAPEDMPKLFQPFVQIDSRLNRQYTGTGLGLSLVRRIAELHQGQIEVDSTLGRGSCFTLSIPSMYEPTSLLPVLSEPSGQPQQHNSLSLSYGDPVPETPPPSCPLTAQPIILLAEDNQANIDTFSNYLTHCGYHVISARTGRSAIDLAINQSPDLILMDIQMPEMDGLEAIRQIRTLPHLAQVPIIALTALAMYNDQTKCLAAGANDYLTKPVSLRYLLSKIKEHLVV